MSFEGSNIDNGEPWPSRWTPAQSDLDTTTIQQMDVGQSRIPPEQNVCHVIGVLPLL